MASGTALAGIQLVLQILDGCKKGYETIESALDMPDEFRYLSVQFKIEQNRFQDFAQAAGLSEVAGIGPVHGFQAKESVLLSILTEIKEVLEKFTINSGRGPLSPGGSASHPIQSNEGWSLGRKYTSTAQNIAPPERPATGIYRSLKWGIFDKDYFEKLLQRLRRSNNYLHELLDDRQAGILQRTQQETYMGLIQVRSSVSDLKVLAQASQSSRMSLETSVSWQQKADLELENLVAFKILYASLLREPKSNINSLEIPVSCVRLHKVDNVGQDHPQATLTRDSSSSSSVWISWQNHEAPIEESESALLAPIEELTILLTAPKPDEFCVPPCLGYCDFGSKLNNRLGLIFKNPPHIASNTPPQSLMRAIKNVPKPSLTCRIGLAFKMARCLLYLHSVNWLHKGLRGENILFFPSQVNDHKHILMPYVTGFGYSRRARFNEETTHVPRTGNLEVYRHPDIQSNGPMLYYRKTFDIYSLGIILIEIAHWRPIASIVDIEGTMEISPEATSGIQSRWLTSEPSLDRSLRGEVGNRYADAVRTCIAARDSFGVARSDLETSANTSLLIQQGFNASVVGKLQEITT